MHDPAGGAPRPLLSLCIFTLNRAALLERCLREVTETVKALPFKTEVLCLDTGSTDYTVRVLADYTAMRLIPNFRAINFARVLPEHEALFAAARLARGEFMFWLPDDDRIEPEGLARALAELQSDPGVVASFSPQIEVEDGTDRRLSVLNGCDLPVCFERGNLAGAAKFLIEGTYHPEMPLVRTEALRRHVTRPRKSFLGYWLMLSLLKAGDVQLRTEGFFIHRLRPQGGAHDQVQWTYAVDRMDQHRLAFELLLARSGLRDAMAGAIPRRMAGYAQGAAAIAARAGQWQAALEFSTRAALAGVPPLLGGSLLEMQQITAADRLAEEIAERLRALPACDHVLFAALERQPVMKALGARGVPDHGTAQAFVVADTAAERDWHLGQGVEPWRVVALQDLEEALSVVPIPA